MFFADGCIFIRDVSKYFTTLDYSNLDTPSKSITQQAHGELVV